MGETKNMHFVPKTYLKRFAVEEVKGGTKQYFIHALNKTLKRPSERRNIKNICYEKSLYEMPGATEEERQLIERMYRVLYEDGYNVLYELMVDKERMTITPSERYQIVRFVISLFYRNIIWNIGFNSLMDQTLAKVHYLTQVDGQQSFFFEEQEISIAGKTLDQLQQENRERDRPLIAATNAQAIFALTRLRVKNDFISIVKARPGYQFVTSDNPVICTNGHKGYLMPFDPGNSFWLPIDKDHLLQIEPWADQLDPSMIGRTSEPIPGIMTSMNNRFQWHQSIQWVMGTQAGVEAVKRSPNGILEESIRRQQSQ